MVKRQALCPSCHPSHVPSCGVRIGTLEEVRERMQAYRKTGMTLPIITPAVEPEGRVEQAMEVLRACAPPA